MSLLKKIKKNHEDKILAKAKLIEEKRALEQQTKLQELEARKKYVEELLNSPIEKDYIVMLRHYIRDNNDIILYGEYDYFLCPKICRDIRYGETITVIKITGSNLGDKYKMYRPGFMGSLNVELLDRNGRYWEGNPLKDFYIPLDCATIRQLNEYATAKNIERKEKYEEKVAKTNQVREQFFK